MTAIACLEEKKEAATKSCEMNASDIEEYKLQLATSFTRKYLFLQIYFFFLKLRKDKKLAEEPRSAEILKNSEKESHSINAKIWIGKMHIYHLLSQNINELITKGWNSSEFTQTNIDRTGHHSPQETQASMRSHLCVKLTAIGTMAATASLKPTATGSVATCFCYCGELICCHHLLEKL